MDSVTDSKLPPKLSLTALLTSGIICTLSAIYIILSIVAIVLRHLCLDNHHDVHGSLYLFDTIYWQYFKIENCSDLFTDHPYSSYTTSESTIFIFVIITLVVSVFCVGTSVFLIVTIKKKNFTQYFVKAAYIYIGSCMISLAIDITLAGFLCSDYIYFIRLMAQNSPGLSFNYELDISRLSAFVLMIISLKGVLPHIINVVLIILLIIYLVEYKRDLLSDEHSIHKMGPLNAYDQDSRDDNWNLQNESPDSPYARGSRINDGFTRDETRHKPRDPHFSEQSGSRSYDNSYDRPYDNADPWRKHHNQTGLGIGNRPFSYLEEASRPMPMKPLASPAAEPSRRRDYDPWEQPPFIPAPDYSPQARRLKSALKPTYM